LATAIRAADVFDVAPKTNIWTGSYSLVSPGTVRNSSNAAFSSDTFPLTKDFEVQVKVFLQAGYRQGGIYLNAGTPAGIWLYQSSPGVLGVRGSFGSSQLTVNGAYLLLRKEGSVLTSCWRENKTTAWKTFGTTQITQTAGAIAVGLLGTPDLSFVGQSDFSELQVKPYESVGNWTSAPVDLTIAPTTTGTISWVQQLPVGTKIEMQTCTSQDGSAWSNWSPVYASSLGSTITSPNARFIRVGVTLYSDVTNQSTPVLDSIRIEYPDATPLGPVIQPLSHPSALWASPTALSLLWSMPAGNPAPEASYTYWLRCNGNLTATASAAVAESPGSPHPLTVSLPQEGSYTFDLQVTGDATSGARTASAQTYSFGYDATPPGQTSIESPTHPQLLFTNNRNPVFHLSATDAVSGVSGYAAVLDKASLGDPGSVVNAGADLRYSALDNGTWYLHARAIDKAGNAGPVSHYGIRIDFNGELLSQDYVKALPNPVRSDTAQLEYELAAPATDVSLEFLNSQGELLKSVEGSRNVGKNRYAWDLGGLANGVYLFRVKARSAEDGKTYTVVRKVAVIR
jgi:hypothetical protein